MKKALIGHGGHAKEVMSIMEQQMVCFIDDDYYFNHVDKEDSSSWIRPLSTLDPTEFCVMVCIGDSATRKAVVSRLPKGIHYFSFIHPSSVINPSDQPIGEGIFIGPFCSMIATKRLGSHSILVRACHIGHDCEIGDYFSMMPGSILSGNVCVGDCVYLGAQSCVKENVSITHHVMVGMGTVVIRDIEHPGMYVNTHNGALRKLE
uniref:PglD N-terminal domain-containing protein n=1 Tax=viral metagenome TaxID=1070528 RepID=A0A6C0D0N6_9ZZZZ